MAVVPLLESAMAEQSATFLRQLGKMLHTHHSSVVEDRLPRRWVELINALNERDRLDRKRHATDKHEKGFYERWILIADRHIVNGERHVAEQRARISRLHDGGLDTSEAEWLLGEFEEILREMLRHRRMLIQHSAKGH